MPNVITIFGKKLHNKASFLMLLLTFLKCWQLYFSQTLLFPSLIRLIKVMQDEACPTAPPSAATEHHMPSAPSTRACIDFCRHRSKIVVQCNGTTMWYQTDYARQSHEIHFFLVPLKGASIVQTKVCRVYFVSNDKLCPLTVLTIRISFVNIL